MTQKKTAFVIAVSGGVDSIVLLHKIVSRIKNSPAIIPSQYPVRYIVAHFDHGIREDSKQDAQFVKKIAIVNGLDYEIGEGKLGAGVSEADAREARYQFLRLVKDKYSAEKIITAHHQNDVLETMIINIIRGTGFRGLAPMTQSSDILRPFLHMPKQSLLDYAKKHNLKWHEDSTNCDLKYLRNHVRKNIVPKIGKRAEKMLEINSQLEELIGDIDLRIKSLLPPLNTLNRLSFVSLPYSIQTELIRQWLINNSVKNLNKKLIEKCVVACKTLKIGKKIDVDERLWLESSKQNLLLTSK